MSMTNTSINTFNHLRYIMPGNKVNVRHQSFSFNPLLSHHRDQLRISKRSVRSTFPDSRRSLRYLSNGKRGQSNNKSKMDFAICSSDQQGDLASFGSFMESWKGWILGGLVTVILPFLTHKWGPLLKWTKELVAAEERVEEMAEAVEKVAVEVDKVAEDIAENLPEGGRFKVALTFVENAAKEVIKDADLVEEFIHKVEDVESIIIEEDVDAKSEEDAKVDNVEDVDAKSEEDAKVDNEEDVDAKSEEDAKVDNEEDLDAKSEEDAKVDNEEDVDAKSEEDAKVDNEEDLDAKSEEEDAKVDNDEPN